MSSMRDGYKEGIIVWTNFFVGVLVLYGVLYWDWYIDVQVTKNKAEFVRKMGFEVVQDGVMCSAKTQRGWVSCDDIAQ